MIRDAWYAAGWSHELRSNVIGRKLLEKPIALFRDGSGTAVAVDAECPHRGANLGGGRVVDGKLECPYHGWQFDGTGRCTLVPSQPPSAKIPERARVQKYSLEESQGILWFWGGDAAPTSPCPRYDFWSASERVKRSFAPARLWRASFAQVAEQSIDTTHGPFVHRVSLGAGQLRQNVRFEAEVDPDGRGMGWADAAPPPTGKSGLRAMIQRRVLGIDPVRREFRFELGGTAYLRVEHRNGGWDVTIFLMTPADDDSTWFFAETVRTHSRDAASDYLHRSWLARVVEEDSALAALMLRKDTGAELPPLSVAADSVTLTFRKLYRRLAADGRN